MSRSVWKYQVPLKKSSHTFEMPGEGPKAIQLGSQAGVPCVWVEVDPDSAHRTLRTYSWFGTGWLIPLSAIHLGTLQSGELVFHLYQVD